MSWKTAVQTGSQLKFIAVSEHVIQTETIFRVNGSHAAARGKMILLQFRFRFDCNEMIQKIELLINNPKLRSQFAEKAFLCMDEFRLEKIVKQWKEILESL